MNNLDKELLLQIYGEEYGPDAGPWNTSAKSKYLEYRITAFFEEYFSVNPADIICNIGIGAGNWDRYLSYRLKNGTLTSIDIDSECCKLFELKLENEKNPSLIKVINSDVLLLNNLDNRFDIVTMVGSTRLESGLFEKIIIKAIKLVKPGGSLYYQTLDKDEGKDFFEEICKNNSCRIEKYELDTKYGLKAQYFKAVKEIDDNQIR
jgi:ubiquinone/menaquinone biosynthesis C-methylase UbiE